MRWGTNAPSRAAERVGIGELHRAASDLAAEIYIGLFDNGDVFECFRHALSSPNARASVDQKYELTPNKACKESAPGLTSASESES